MDKSKIATIWSDMCFKILKKTEPQYYNDVIHDYYMTRCREPFIEYIPEEELNGIFDNALENKIDNLKELGKKFGRKQIDIYNELFLAFTEYLTITDDKIRKELGGEYE